MDTGRNLSDVVEFLSGIKLEEDILLSVYSDSNYLTKDIFFNIHVSSLKKFIAAFPEHSMEPNANSDWDTKLYFRVNNAVFFTLTSRGEYVRAMSHQESTTK